MHETSTRSPGATVVTAEPTDSTVPTAENPPFGDLGHVALQNVEVRTADGGAVDPHNGVGVVDDLWVRDFFPGFGSWSVEHECFHVTLFSLGVAGRWCRSISGPEVDAGR
jgi:hypothetical protein